MEELVDLNLVSSNLSGLDDFCPITMGNETDMSGDNGRPSSTLSMSSWTFSPISDNNNTDVNEDLDSSEKSDVPNVTNQHLVPGVCQPTVNSVATEQDHSFIQQANLEGNIQNCEYVYPITYHHSVNIHNYVGNYCYNPQSAWKPEVIYQMPPSFPCYPTRPEHHPQQMLSKADHTDPLVMINTAELPRCTTPEYMMALNSLHQMESPPRPNHAAAMNVNYTCSSFNNSINRPMQDSGYCSDLADSPIIQYQDGNIKLRQSRLTSTPQPPPIVRLSNLAALQDNKENLPTVHQHFPSTKVNSVEFMNKPKQMGVSNHNLYMQSANQKSVSNYVKSDVKSDKKEPQFASMAEFQQAKRSAAKKRKLSSSSSSSSASSLETSDKRRRHNEPLNNMALEVMNNWYLSNSENPYPTKTQKEELAKQGGITLSQVKSWFANKRNRSNNTRPKKQKLEMEERLMEICHQLARDAQKPAKDNAYYIQQLSSILHR